MSAPSASAPPVVGTGRPTAVRVGLVHGLAESPAVWAPLLPLLPPDVEVVAPAMPWSLGDPQAWSQARHDGRPDPFDGAAPDVLVAHSLGANITLRRLTSSGPSPRPAAVVLVSPFYRPSADDFDWSTIEELAGDFRRLFHERIRLRRGADRYGLSHDMSRRVCERVGPYGALRFLEILLGTPDLPLHRLGEPCVVLTGEHDRAARPGDARSLAAALPDAEFRLVAGCGHFPMLERPTEVHRAITDLLLRITPTRGTPPASSRKARL